MCWGWIRSYIDLGLLWSEVPLNAGVCVSVESDLDDALLHWLHCLHQIRIVAAHRCATKPCRLTDKHRGHTGRVKIKTSVQDQYVWFCLSSPDSKVCRAEPQRTTGRSSPPQLLRCMSAPSCSWSSTLPPGSWSFCAGSSCLYSVCGSADEASTAEDVQPESAASWQCRTEASGHTV